MKKLIVGLFCFLTAAVLANPGYVHKKTLTFVWDPPPASERIDGYKLYVTTNLPTGLSYPIPSDEQLLTFQLPPAATNDFTLFMTVPGGSTSVTFTNIWSTLGQQAFFVLTATNDVAESFFSNPAWIPAPPSPVKNLQISINR